MGDRIAMNNFNPGLEERIESFLWPDVRPAYPKWLILRGLRLVYSTSKDLIDGHLTLRAMSLVYTTLLSIVPLLALSFSVLKALGVHNTLEPYLFQLLTPLGDKGVEIGNHLIGSIDNMKVGVLGSLGLGLLIYTVLSLVQKIESAFNMIWHVEITRTLGERFSSYLSVILIGPVLMVSALGITASFMSSSLVQYVLSIEPFGSLIILATKLMPYFMVIGVFAFIYIFVPNTRVRLRPALLGAIVAGILWQTSGMLFASFVVNSSKYTAVYSSFAIVILMLIWLYVSWLILLLGSTIAFYIQNPSYLRISRDHFRLSGRVKEILALMLMQAIGRSHYAGVPGPTSEQLSEEMNVPDVALSHVLQRLIEAGLIVQSNDSKPRYLPGKALDTLSVGQVLLSIRTADEAYYLKPEMLIADSKIHDVVDRAGLAVQDALSGRTVKDLIVSEPDTAPVSMEKAKAG